MSRMIDADALKSNMFNYAPPEMTWDRGDIEHKIDEQPTIDAIPVEWLNKQCEMADDRGDMEMTDAISWLIQMWHEEQEAQDSKA